MNHRRLSISVKTFFNAFLWGCAFAAFPSYGSVTEEGCIVDWTGSWTFLEHSCTSGEAVAVACANLAAHGECTDVSPGRKSCEIISCGDEVWIQESVSSEWDRNTRTNVECTITSMRLSVEYRIVHDDLTVQNVTNDFGIGSHVIGFVHHFSKCRQEICNTYFSHILAKGINS